MRRGLIAFVIAGLVLPLVLGVGPAAAQLQLNTYPGNVVDVSRTAVTIANSTTATTLYTYTVPARFFQNLRQPYPGAGSLHLTLLGTITTNASAGGVGTINVGCSYGGTTASISLVNGVAPTANLTAQPVRLELQVRTLGTGTTSEVVHGRLEITNVSGAATTAPSIYTAAVTGTTSSVANQTLNCTWLWASASATNSLTINSAVLSLGQ